METHIIDPILPRRALARKGMASAWAPATPTSAMGSSGGACLVAKSGVPCSFVAQSQDALVSQIPKAPSDQVDWVFGVCHAKGLSFALIALYLDCKVGITARNVLKLQSLGAFIRRLKVPVAVIGDWNVPSDVLLQSQWAELLDLEVVHPTDLELTCTTGGGSAIDYMLISRPLRRSVESFTRAKQSPWAPHIALSLRMSLEPKSLWIRSIFQPKAFPIESLQLPDGGRRHISDEHWQCADAFVPLPIAPDYLSSSVAYRALPPSHVHLTNAYAEWSHRLETAILRAGAPLPKPHKFCGRARWPSYVSRRVACSPKCLDQHDIYANVVLGTCQCMLSQVTELRLLFLRGSHSTQQGTYLRRSIPDLAQGLIDKGHSLLREVAIPYSDPLASELEDPDPVPLLAVLVSLARSSFTALEDVQALRDQLAEAVRQLDARDS